MDWLHRTLFNFIQRHNLVYNTCWEDPRLDRQALQFGPEDTVLVITSAGCNALDYLLQQPRRVYAVDLNPRQNALLELKLAAIRELDYESFFSLFGAGYLTGAAQTYRQKLRRCLSAWSRSYWDRWIHFFDRRDRGFYFRGTAGGLAKVLNLYADRVVKLRPWLDRILEAGSVQEQRQIYEQHLRDRFWTRGMKFAIGRDTTLSLVGVPRVQRQQVERDYTGGIVRFIQDCVEAVFARLPLADNYFWRVYLTGSYTTGCCPEYLKPDNFFRLRQGLTDRISIHTNTVQAFLENHPRPISRFVLLDHMDWFAGHRQSQLEAEWRAILRCATPGARFLWRSGGLRTDFVDRARVLRGGRWCELGELLSYDRNLAAELHARDRVHTYGSMHIATLAA